ARRGPAGRKEEHRGRRADRRLLGARRGRRHRSRVAGRARGDERQGARRRGPRAAGRERLRREGQDGQVDRPLRLPRAQARELAPGEGRPQDARGRLGARGPRRRPHPRDLLARGRPGPRARHAHPRAGRGPAPRHPRRGPPRRVQGPHRVDL
ncbi:MAG: hypothetical protein AVDCRST_MAG30-4137, partial [uncultured Solirubrobacteraceae bacterium]